LAEEMEAWTAAQGKRLIIAAYQGESERVSAILAEPFFSSTSATGQPATGRPTTGSPLTHYISIDWADKEGQTALHLAADNGHVECTRLVLSKGAAVHLCNRYGNTALHLASDRGFADCARLLLEAGAAVDKKNNDGATALQCACITGHRDCVTLALDYGADILAQYYGRTALDWAEAKGRTQCAELLRERTTDAKAAREAERAKKRAASAQAGGAGPSGGGPSAEQATSQPTAADGGSAPSEEAIQVRVSDAAYQVRARVRVRFGGRARDRARVAVSQP